jgi:hypothetical protein
VHAVQHGSCYEHIELGSQFVIDPLHREISMCDSTHMDNVLERIMQVKKQCDFHTNDGADMMHTSHLSCQSCNEHKHALHLDWLTEKAHWSLTTETLIKLIHSYSTLTAIDLISSFVPCDSCLWHPCMWT